jgi:hypothetical protein
MRSRPTPQNAPPPLHLLQRHQRCIHNFSQHPHRKILPNRQIANQQVMRIFQEVFAVFFDVFKFLKCFLLQFLSEQVTGGDGCGKLYFLHGFQHGGQICGVP